MIIYDQPVPGLDEHGNEVTCNQQVAVTREDAVKIQRYAFKQLLEQRGSEYGVAGITKQHLFEEYVTVHWAYEEL